MFKLLLTLEIVSSKVVQIFKTFYTMIQYSSTGVNKFLTLEVAYIFV